MDVVPGQYQISVVITSYNQEGYLREAIDSVLSQTLLPFEIIVADDCSTQDRSVELIESYAARHPGLIVPLLQERNLGIPLNRNRALSLARGSHVLILDGDDFLLPRFLEQHVDALRQMPGAGATYGNRFNLYPGGERRVRNREPEPSGRVLAHLATRMGVVRSMVARRDLVMEAGAFDPGFYHHDGFILALRLARLTAFVHVSEPLMVKREHAAGSSKGIAAREKVFYYEGVYAETRRLTVELPREERRRIDDLWSGKIVEQQTVADLEEGHRARSYRRLAKRFFRSPRRASECWKLVRKIRKTN